LNKARMGWSTLPLHMGLVPLRRVKLATCAYGEQVLAAGAANGEALASGASPQQLPSRQKVRE